MDINGELVTARRNIHLYELIHLDFFEENAENLNFSPIDFTVSVSNHKTCSIDNRFF